MGVESARMSIKDFIFQDTVLKDYKLFVDKKKRRIDEEEYKDIVIDKFKQGLLPKHFLQDIVDEEQIEKLEEQKKKDGIVDATN